jgi:Fe-S-cluster containining protein
VRKLFLWWQERVNGFVLTAAEAESRTFVFRCTHFDPVARSCDSYDSRPGMCRDYPRLQLWESNPDFLPGCGYRAVTPNAARLTALLAEQPLSAEQREKLRRGLRLQ